MINPIYALLIATAIAALFAMLFWPQKGFFWQFYKHPHLAERILMEDALKHLYHQKAQGQRASLDSVAGALAAQRDECTKVLARLEEKHLIQTLNNTFELTSDGEAYALRIIRTHRLWELYFADKTGYSELEWHNRAEEREHFTSESEAEALAEKMQFPLFDPHGDPIPTVEGELPPTEGIPLSDLETDELARVVHLEDEPDTIFAQLIAEGLAPGMQIRIIDKTPKRVLFTANGEEIRLAPVVAANVTVKPLPKETAQEGPFESLISLNFGQTGVVQNIAKSCRGLQRRRLMDLGIVPGTEITSVMPSAGGNPIAYNIRGAMIALRTEQASMIHIKRKEAAA